MSEHWHRYSRLWDQLGPPLRPAAQAVATYKQALAGTDGPALMYGVTPELAELPCDITAVDATFEMIKTVWPGDNPSRRVVGADWLRLPFPNNFFGAVVGDAT